MNVTCSPRTLQDGLEMAGRAVSKHSILPVLSNVHLSADGDGDMAVSASNLTVAIRTRIDTAVLEPGAITVPAHTITDLVTLLDDDLTLELDENTATLHLVSGRTKANIKGIPASEFIVIPDYPALKREHDLPTIAIEPADLERALNRTVFSAAKDDNRPTLAAVYLHTVEDHLALASVDGHRLSVQHLPEIEEIETDFPNLLIPKAALQEVQRLVTDETDPVQIIVNEDRTGVAFIFSRTHLVSQLVEGNYPNYPQIIPERCAIQVTASSSDLRRALKVALAFDYYSCHSTRWVVDADSMTIASTHAETGDQATTVTASIEVIEGELKEPFRFGLDGRYALDALRAIGPTAQVKISLVDPVSPIVFQCVGDDTYTHVIMPQHIEE